MENGTRLQDKPKVLMEMRVTKLKAPLLSCHHLLSKWMTREEQGREMHHTLLDEVNSQVTRTTFYSGQWIVVPIALQR